MDRLRNAIGPRHLAAARETVPGLLAAALSEFLYCAEVRQGETKHHENKLVGLAKLRRFTNGKQPWNAKTWVEQDGTVNTEKMLRECRDYLEVISFREVID